MSVTHSEQAHQKAVVSSYKVISWKHGNLGILMDNEGYTVYSVGFSLNKRQTERIVKNEYDHRKGVK